MNKKEFSLKTYTKDVDFREYEKLSVQQALKAMCKNCCAFQVSEVKQCNLYTCPLHQFNINDFRIRK